MLNLLDEIQGFKQARDDRRTLRLLADALTGEVLASTLDEPTRQRLFDAATAHGVLGLFPLPHPEVPVTVTAGRAKTLRALKFTHRVVDAIEGAGVPVVVLKGAVAGSRWPDPTLRQQSDVDVLVEKRHKDEAARALIAARICSERFLDSDQMHNDSLLPAEASGLMVELHHYFNNHHATRVEVSELLGRRVRVKTALGELPAMAPEDDAVYLALHATTHALQRLAWLVDLAGLRCDWAEAARRARAWNVALAVDVAWERARTLLRVPIPPVALPAVQRTVATSILAAADGSRGETHRLLERTFRLSVVPPLQLPAVLVQKLRARREEHAAYAKKGKA